MFTRDEKYKYEVKSFERASDLCKKTGVASRIGAALKAGTIGLTFGKAAAGNAAPAKGAPGSKGSKS